MHDVLFSFDKFSSSDICSSVKPVVPITVLIPIFKQYLAFSKIDDGWVKSTRTSIFCSFLACSIVFSAFFEAVKPLI